MASSPRPASPRSPDCHSCCSSDGACSSSTAGFQASDPGKSDDCPSDEEYFKPLKRLCMIHLQPDQDTECNKNNNNNNNINNNKQLTPFSVRDILECKPTVKRTVSDGGHSGRIVRPWDLDDSERRRPRSVGDDSRSERSDSDGPESPPSQHAAASTSPLDALFEMTSKAFEGIEGNENSSDSSRDHLHIFSTRQQPKKKRKSRTAFTNHQIFELEKRFLYQKYLSPADRDEIAQSLGLTNAQVITWFQNRRAKLKRDMEELKKDVDATKINHVHRNLMDNIQDLSILKTELDKKSSISVK